MSNYRKLQQSEWECYFVSTVGRDEEVIRHYIQRQENEDRTQDQLKFS